MCTGRRALNAGFTLPELILLIVVIAIGLAGILMVFQRAVSASADPVINKQAIAIAESMIDEILLMPFNKPAGSTFAGGCANATQANRPRFDSVQDYDCFPHAGGPPVTGITTINGAAIPGLAAYSVRVAVADTALQTVPAADSRRITVTVTGPGTTVELQGFKLNF
jgi:MSHA pilin protein MshD